MKVHTRNLCRQFNRSAGRKHQLQAFSCSKSSACQSVKSGKKLLPCRSQTTSIIILQNIRQASTHPSGAQCFQGTCFQVDHSGTMRRKSDSSADPIRFFPALLIDGRTHRKLGPKTTKYILPPRIQSIAEEKLAIHSFCLSALPLDTVTSTFFFDGRDFRPYRGLPLISQRVTLFTVKPRGISSDFHSDSRPLCHFPRDHRALVTDQSVLAQAKRRFSPDRLTCPPVDCPTFSTATDQRHGTPLCHAKSLQRDGALILRVATLLETFDEVLIMGVFSLYGTLVLH